MIIYSVDVGDTTYYVKTLEKAKSIGTNIVELTIKDLETAFFELLNIDSFDVIKVKKLDETD